MDKRIGNLKIGSTNARNMMLDALDKEKKNGNLKSIAERIYNHYSDNFKKSNITIKEFVKFCFDLLNEYGEHFAGYYGISKLNSVVTEETRYFNY